jgi:hypothetical protein
MSDRSEALLPTARARRQVACACGVLTPFDAYEAVNAASDPALVSRLLEGNLNAGTCAACQQPVRADVPVIYHDPAWSLVALVLPAARRAFEIDERVAYLRKLQDIALPLPSYALSPRVVYELAALLNLLEQHGELVSREASVDAREKDLVASETRLREEREAARQAESAAREAERRADGADRRAAEAERRAAEAERRGAEAEARASDASDWVRRSQGQQASILEDARTALARAERAEAALAAERANNVQKATSAGRQSASDADDELPREQTLSSTANPFSETSTNPVPLLDDGTGRGRALAQAFGGAVRGGAFRDDDRDDSDALVTGEHAVAVPRDEDVPVVSRGGSASPRERGLEAWLEARAGNTCFLAGDEVVVASAVPTVHLDGLLGAPIGARIQLHRDVGYPVVALVVGDAARIEAEDARVVLTLDPGDSPTRAVLGALSKDFRLRVELHDEHFLPVASRDVATPLEENVARVIAAAEAELRNASGVGFTEAARAVAKKGPHLFGRRPAGFGEDAFAKLPTVGAARLALGVVGHWASRENEEYLLLVKSFPVPSWRTLRARVLARAVEFGLPLPEPLVQDALESGLAKSRGALHIKLANALAETLSSPLCDLDPAQRSETVGALERALQAEDVELDRDLRRRLRDAGDDRHPDSSGGQASGDPIPRAEDPTAASTNDLVHWLDDRERRLAAVVELCRRGEPSALPVMANAIRRMSRSEASTALPALVSLGRPSVTYLLDALQSRKSYLRQGAALALAALRATEAAEPLGELLLSEPTDIWVEVARSLGDLGASAVRVLLPRARAADAEAAARLALALAHTVDHGGREPLQAATMRDDGTAATARRALGLASEIGEDDRRLRTGRPTGAETVVRAFSRRFFGALSAGPSPTHDFDHQSGGVRKLEENDEAEPLDEADLIEA